MTWSGLTCLLMVVKPTMLQGYTHQVMLIVTLTPDLRGLACLPLEVKPMMLQHRIGRGGKVNQRTPKCSKSVAGVRTEMAPNQPQIQAKFCKKAVPHHCAYCRNCSYMLLNSELHGWTPYISPNNRIMYLLITHTSVTNSVDRG